MGSPVGIKWVETKIHDPEVWSVPECCVANFAICHQPSNGIRGERQYPQKAKGKDGIGDTPET
jgi:hypothetical protein